VHDAHRRRVPGRGLATPRKKPELVEYADGDEASAFAQMLGGLIGANVEQRPEKRRDFEALSARVGIDVTDLDEAVTLDFKRGRLVVSNGLKRGRQLTIRAESDTVMTLSNLSILPVVGLPNYTNSTGREVLGKLVNRKLRIDGMLANMPTLNRVTRVFSVR
jgi:hypothetical protein